MREYTDQENSKYGHFLRSVFLENIKGYLRYKTTSQNVLSEAQVKNFFIS